MGGRSQSDACLDHNPAVDESLTDVLVEYELAARSTLTQAAFDYIAAGAGDELCLEESQGRLAALPAPTSHLARRCDTRIFRPRSWGTQLAMPLVVAPTAYQHGRAQQKARSRPPGA